MKAWRYIECHIHKHSENESQLSNCNGQLKYPLLEVNEVETKRTIQRTKETDLSLQKKK
jgi:hypothetical protein